MITRNPPEIHDSAEIKPTIAHLNNNMELTSDGLLSIKSHLGELNFLDDLKPEVFDAKEIQTLSQNISKETDGYLIWREKIYLQEYISKLLSDNKIHDKTIQQLLSQNKLQSLFLELLYYAKYILLTKELNKRDIYIDTFKKLIDQLIMEAGKENFISFINACKNENNLFKIFPLIISLIKTHGDQLDNFNLSELIAHRIAYEIGKHPGFIKIGVVTNKNKEPLYSYLVEEVQFNHGLKAAFLLSNQLESEPCLRIVWPGTHNSNSAKLNSEITPGEESYRRNEDQLLKLIIEKINFLYQIYHKPIHIVISGHSLGGALAQLNFHSLQRILLMNSKHSEQAKLWEIELQKKLIQETAGVAHQRSLEDIKISPSAISQLTLHAWNSPGVLESIAKHSNQMAPLLVDNEIKLNACYGMVHGDIVQTSGRGMVLSDVKQNKAKVSILKIEPNKLSLNTKSLAGVGALSVGKTLSAAAIAGPLGAVATTVTLGGMTYASLTKIMLAAHRMHHFLKSSNPQNPYYLLSSHHPDGSLNENDCAMITSELNFKSFIVDAGARALSQFEITHTRTATLKEKEEDLFKNAIKQSEESKSSEPILQLIAKELSRHNPFVNEIVLKLIDEKKISITASDVLGKSILHYAIESHNEDLVKQLLSKPYLDINLQDKEGNTPLLTCLLHNSIQYDIGLQLLTYPGLDLTIKNHKGVNAKMLYESWTSHGLPGSRKREFCLQLKSTLTKLDEANHSFEARCFKYLNLLN